MSNSINVATFDKNYEILNSLLQSNNNNGNIIKILKSLGYPKYILIFEPYMVFKLSSPTTLTTYCVAIPEYPSGGDFAKSRWMIRIPSEIFRLNVSDRDYIEYEARIGTERLAVPKKLTPLLYYLTFNLEVLRSSQMVIRYCRELPTTWIFYKIPQVVPRGNITTIVFGRIFGYSGPTFNIIPVTPPEFKLVYVSRPYGWVLLYKINYTALLRS